MTPDPSRLDAVWRRSLVRRYAPALAIVAAAAIAAGGAAAARNPTPAQKAALVAALRAEQGEVAIQSIAVSTALPTYARMGWGYKIASHNTLFQLDGGAWKMIWTAGAAAPADGACAFVPSQVARDLLEVSCPSGASLHARAATKGELALLARSFHHSPVTPYARSEGTLSHVCVSRLSPSWAAAITTFPGTAGVVWFRHGSSWQVVAESLFGRGAIPSHRIVLSLASCVGYNASDY